MRLLKSDLIELAEACIDGKLADIKVEWHDGFAVCVILAAPGYPLGPVTGYPIVGIEEANKLPEVVVFHAGTKISEFGELVTAGGRVLAVTAVGDSLDRARSRAYAGVSAIHFDRMHFRHDIGSYCM